MYQVNIINEYSETIKSMFAQNRSSVYITVEWFENHQKWGKWRCVQLRDETSVRSSRSRNCIGSQTEKYQDPRKKDDSFICTYTCYSGFLATGIGLDWIAASAVQTLKTSMWVGLSRSCFKLKLHFPVHHVRPATIYSYVFPPWLHLLSISNL